MDFIRFFLFFFFFFRKGHVLRQVCNAHEIVQYVVIQTRDDYIIQRGNAIRS